MINKGQNNPIHRNYAEVIAAAKNKKYQHASTAAKAAGEKRRKVDALMEKRRLAKELDLWTTT